MDCRLEPAFSFFMECWTTLTESNLPRVLFILDAYGILEPGKFVVIAYGDKGRVVALSKGGLAKIVDNFDEFNRVVIKFECNRELAKLLGVRILATT